MLVNIELYYLDFYAKYTKLNAICQLAVIKNSDLVTTRVEKSFQEVS